MAFQADKIWFNGELVDWDKAKIHVLSHVVHYGSGVFEGLRLYKVGSRSAVFRLKEHIRRLFMSAKIYRMLPKFSEAEINKATLEILRVNKLPSAYIRPLIFRGFKELGLSPLHCPVDVVIAAWTWGTYRGEAGLKNGISACTSSWFRPAPNTLPNLAKGCGNYLSSQLIKMEALERGFDEGIALDVRGNLAEGSGENLFVVKDGTLYTPEDAGSILPGITRDAILTLAKELGIPVKQATLPREILYLADELFLCGTAAEVTPVSKIDSFTVANGAVGEITRALQSRFFSIVNGESEDTYNWLTYI